MIHWVLLESGEVWKENSSIGLIYRKVIFLSLWLSPEGLRVGPIRCYEYIIFCSTIGTRRFPHDCSSSASLTLVAQASNLGQAHRKRLLSWFFVMMHLFYSALEELNICPLTSNLYKWQMQHHRRWWTKCQALIKEAYKGILPTKAFWGWIHSSDAHKVFNLSMA